MRSSDALSENFGSQMTMNHKPGPPPVSLSIDQFCERYGITKRWYYMLRDRGEGPAEVRIGSRKIRITETAAAEWEVRHTHQPEAGDAQTKKKTLRGFPG